MTDRERLAGYVDVWWQAVNDFTDLLEQIPAEDWSTPTDLDGWDVKAIASHIAHLEGILAGAPEETVEVGEPDARHRADGALHRAGRRRPAPTSRPTTSSTRSARPSTKRHTALLSDPPTDGSAKPERIFGGIGWTWNTLLRNRPLDIWMHEQDIRRAVGLPGGMDSPAARHTAEYLAESVGFVVAKRVGAPTGTTVVVEIAGSAPLAFTVNDNGRGEQLAEIPADPTVRLVTDREAFIVLAGGRRTPEPGSVVVTGDTMLGQKILDTLAVTP